MGMVCTLKRVNGAKVDEIAASPETARGLIEDNADRDFPLEEVRMPGCLGLLLRLTPIKVTQLAQRPEGDSPELLDDPDRMDIEVWDVINFFLTGSPTRGEFPASFLVEGGEHIEDEDDEPDLRVFTAQQVGQIDTYLQTLSRDDLKARIDIPAMIKARLLSRPRKNTPDRNMEYLGHVLDDFESLKTFIHATHERSAGLLVRVS